MHCGLLLFIYVLNDNIIIINEKQAQNRFIRYGIIAIMVPGCYSKRLEISQHADKTYR